MLIGGGVWSAEDHFPNRVRNCWRLVARREIRPYEELRAQVRTI